MNVTPSAIARGNARLETTTETTEGAPAEGAVPAAERAKAAAEEGKEGEGSKKGKKRGGSKKEKGGSKKEKGPSDMLTEPTEKVVFNAPRSSTNTNCRFASATTDPVRSVEPLKPIAPLESAPIHRAAFWDRKKSAPFIDKYKLPFRITNDGARPVGWAIKTNCPARISADPPCGVLDPKGKTILYITCEPFNYQGTDVSADRITIEWILTPENAGKQFKREWFQGDVITRRRNVPINYNV